jgi:hypothetical protein
MTTYERVTSRTEKGTSTVILVDPVIITTSVGPFICGLQVDREGQLVEPPAAYLREAGAETGHRRHMIELALVTRRTPMTMNLKYGWLESAD